MLFMVLPPSGPKIYAEELAVKLRMQIKAHQKHVQISRIEGLMDLLNPGDYP